MEKRKIRLSDIRIGEPLPWPVYNASGVLLLRRGYVITMASQLQKLVQQGIYLHQETSPPRPTTAEAAPAVKVSPFHVFDNLLVRQRRVCEDIGNGAQNDIPGRVGQLCGVLQKICQMDADAMIGAVHLIQEGCYTLLHCLHTAILAEIFLRSMGISAEDRLSILAAAITKDVGMQEIQDALYRQTTPLTAEQRAEINKHPLKSAHLLEKSGVQDGIWLETVLHHHERLNGSGYPHGLKDDDIFFPARVLSLVDIYSAMTKGRAWRGAIKSLDTMRQLFSGLSDEVDSHLAKLFIKELSLFPPGVFVRLNNGEIAIITRRGKEGAPPQAHAVIGPRGAPLSNAQKRDTGQKDFAIRELVERPPQLTINLHALWGYD